MTGECLSVSAQLDRYQTSLGVKAHPHEWHGIAGCSETAPNKPVPSQTMDCAFETRYRTVFSISNNTVQQCSGNPMTHSSDCLHICCRAVALTAAGVWWVPLGFLTPRAPLSTEGQACLLFSLHFACPFVLHEEEEAQQLFLHCAERKSLDLYLWQQQGRGLCNAVLVPQTQGPCYQPTWKSRDQGQQLQHGVHWPKASCHLLPWKPRPCLCGATRSRKATNERQQQTGNLCVWAEACKDTHKLWKEFLLILWCYLYILTLWKQETRGAIQLTSKHWDQNNFTAVFWITFLLAVF